MPLNHSIGQLAILTLLPDGSIPHAVETGWRKKSNEPTTTRLFVARKVNGTYAPYNEGFVQYSASYYPDMPVAESSGSHYAIMKYQSNWWIWYRDEWIGYFPGSDWGEDWVANRVMWYGEVVSDKDVPCSDMGGGGTSARMDRLFFMRDGESAWSKPAGLPSPNETHPQWYQGQLVDTADGDLAFHYGGPGGC